MQAFFALLDLMDRSPPEERGVIEELIWDGFGTEQAVLVLDMAGFSLQVRRAGILSYLCRINSMRSTCMPVVEEFGGSCVKQSADNLTAVFPKCEAAIDAAVEMNRRCAAVAARSGEPVRVSIGIDFGRFLLVSDQDCFGDAVNVAYKLGEDLARAGEVLVTQAVIDRLPAGHGGYAFEEVPFTVSGHPLVAFRVNYAKADPATATAVSTEPAAVMPAVPDDGRAPAPAPTP